MTKPTLPSTSSKVPEHTSIASNHAIFCNTIANIESYKEKSNEEISKRIEQLNKEWDIERVLETNAAAISLASIAMGFAKNKKWFAVPGVISFFLLQHALQGWCPPLPIFRKLGYRTASEINQEITALKYLRGDFSTDNKDLENIFDNSKLN